MSIAKNLFGVSWSHKLEEQERLLRKTESLSSFDDKANGVFIEIGSIIEYQGKVFGDYCEKFVIESIMKNYDDDGTHYHCIIIRKLFSDGTIGQSVPVVYDGRIIKVLSEDEFINLAKIEIDERIKSHKKNIKLIRAAIQRAKHSKNCIREKLEESLQKVKKST